MEPVTLVVIVILLVIIILYFMGKAEHLTTDVLGDTSKAPAKMGAPEGITVPVGEPYVKLYEDMRRTDLRFVFPDPYYGESKDRYLRKIVKINLKSYDINIPKDPNIVNDLRRVEIWSIYDGDNDASLESDFYNSYLEPEYALRANSGKYKKILTVYPGNHAVGTIEEPVKKIALFINL